MSTNKSNIRFLAAALAAAFILPSCADLDEGQGEGVGYLELSGLTADVEVYELVPTKSGTTTLKELGVTEYNAPGIANITFTLKGPESYSKTWQGALNEALELPVGTYTLSGVYDNAENDGLGEALYGDFSTSVAISTQGSAAPAIKLPLINSLVAVSMAEGFDKHFIPAGGDCVTFTSGTAAVNAAVNEYVFVPASSALTVKVEGTNSAGGSKTLTKSDLTSPAARTAYKIVCGMTTTSVPSVTLASDLSAGAFEEFLYFPAATVSNISTDDAAKLTYEIKGGTYSDWTTVTVSETDAYKYISGLTPGTTYCFRARVGNIFSNGSDAGVSFIPADFDDCVKLGTVTAKHNNDGNPSVELSSTTMTSSGMSATLPAIIEELTDVTVAGAFRSANNGATGSFSTNLTSSSKNTPFNNAADWPYLPQGTYTAEVKATCTLNGKTYEKVSSMAGIEVGAPEFGVTVSGKTSYSYYTSGGASVANSKNAETVYEISSSAKISENILSNSNYAKPTVTYSVGGKQVSGTYSASKSHSQGEISSLTWGSHTMTATVNFDNTPCSGTCECVITGLPYSVSFYNITSAPSGWTLGGNFSWTGYGWNRGDGAEYLRLKGASSYSDRGRAISPKFNVPSNINVQTTLDCMHYESSGEKRTIYVNANTSSCPELSTNGTSIKNSVNFDNFDNVADVENQMTLTSSKPHITITHNIPGEGITTKFFGVKSLKIIYN